MLGVCSFWRIGGENDVGDDVMMDCANLAHSSGLCLDLQVVQDNPISARQPLPTIQAYLPVRRSTSMQRHL